MTIESLANDCFKRSGYAINKQDLISRIEFLCEQYHQSKVNNVVLDDVSKREIIKKYKKDRNIQANYKLDEDEMYLIELHLFSVKSSVIIEKERQRIWTELCKEVDEDRLTDDFVGSSDDVYDVIFNGKELE